MLNFLADNWGTILIGLAVAAVVVLILVKMRRDRSKGKEFLRLRRLRPLSFGRTVPQK